MLKLFEKIRENGQKDREELRTEYFIFNTGTELMFAECEKCGFEDDDQFFLNQMLKGKPISGRCPGCGREIAGVREID